MIQFSQVSYQYPNQSDWVLKNIDLTINQGEWVSLIGHNGSGKSTLAKLINGLLRPSEGEVMVGGVELTDENLWDIRRNVGMVFQNPENQFVGTTVIDDVVFGLENMGLSRKDMQYRVDESLELVGLSRYKYREPFNLSGGQKQRLAIASVLAMLPNIMVLDEATTMLDPKGGEELVNTMNRLHKEQQLTMISITHDMKEVLMADRVIVLKEGSIWFDGKPVELLQKDLRIEEAGLLPPFVVKLTNALKKRGITFKEEPLNIEELVKQLWIYRSTT
ncbi:energy-coupling factor transporter ATPase [Piscibacillus halophilus]|uniref:energy-coupling factor transporter ATPase n=1 Tax=Piscibacillus halophilus TaxID=571933 RepID=UPI001589D158|nr:energy-coupling factor transporter ATPase [Piscibacillus halophilus]